MCLKQTNRENIFTNDPKKYFCYQIDKLKIAIEVSIHVFEFYLNIK